VTIADERYSKERFLGDEDVPWEITANSLSYNEKEETYVAKGDVVIKRADQALYAQEAIYSKKTGVAKVSGDVRLEVAGDVLTCEQGTFNLNTQTGEIRDGLLFLKENHFTISGDVIEKLSEDTYLAKNARVTTCEGTKPAWSFAASEVKVTVEGYGKARNATFRIRDVPVFYFPYLIFPAKTKRQSGLLMPMAGYSSLNGAGFELPFFWAISDQADATFYGRYMSKRGYMQGLEFRYVAEQDSKGIFLSDILSDKIEEKDLTDPDQAKISPFARTNTTRYWWRSKTDQDLPYGLVARLDLDYVSDQDYLREFEGELFGLEVRPDLVEEFGRPLEERFSPTRRSALRLGHDGEGYSLQGGGSYFERPTNPPNDPTPQPLGVLNFDLLPREIPYLPLFFKFDTNYEYIWRDVGAKGHSASFAPELSYPILGSRYLQFDSSVRYRGNVQWFDEPFENRDDQFRDSFGIRGKLSTLFERIFPFERKNTKELKHKVMPGLIYDYRTPPDEEKESPWFEPIDVLGRVNRLAFTLENFLDARYENEKGETSYRQWVNFFLSQGYSIDEARRDTLPGEKKQPFEPLAARMTLKPFPNLYFLGSAAWDWDKDELAALNLTLDLSVPRSGNRKDLYKIDYVDREGSNESLNFLIDVNLAYGFSAGVLLNRDLVAKQNVYSSYWLGYQSQCWGVKLSVDRQPGVTRFLISFDLLGLIEDVGGKVWGLE
jgi:LPS-assembly protein